MRLFNIRVGGRWSAPAAALLWIRVIGAGLELLLVLAAVGFVGYVFLGAQS